MRKTAQERIRGWLGRSADQLTDAEAEIIKGALEGRALARDTNRELREQADFGDRVADAIARIGGSWTFIIGFILFLFAWTLANVVLLGRDEFDPYPFVFLNLILSMLAALQAPVIMMSQNRQAERDRIDAANDYAVNLKAEIEIMGLHDKLDELRHMDMVTVRQTLLELTTKVERLEALLGQARSENAEA